MAAVTMDAMTDAMVIVIVAVTFMNPTLVVLNSV